MITKALFGGHMILDKDMTDEGGPFERFYEQTGQSSLRYPGGTVTEKLSHRDGSLAKIFGAPGTSGDPDRVLTVREAFDFADDHDASVQFVLPTKTFFLGTEPGDRQISMPGVRNLMKQVDGMIRGDYGDVTIDTFEIGNEYWYKSMRLSAKEYGRISNIMAKELQATFDAYRAELSPAEAKAWHEPKIIVQAGAGWLKGENAIILDELDMEARGAIDGVVSHFYPENYDKADTAPIMMANMQAFEKAAGFGDLTMMLSEWNIHAAGDGDRGMMQASAMLKAFDFMVDSGIDQANVWGTNYVNLETRLAVMERNHFGGLDPQEVGLELTPAGEVYRMMAEKLPGTEITDIKAADMLEGRIPDADNLSIHGYERDGKLIVFVASRSGSAMNIDLDMDGMGKGYDHVWAQHLTARDDPATSVNEGDPTSPDAKAHLTTLGQDEIGNGVMTLKGYDVVMLEFSAKDEGVVMEGHEGRETGPGLDDTLTGGSGDDIIRGHFGGDVLTGGMGRNILDGGAGNDILQGGPGRDVLIAGSGDNLMTGAAGNNVFIGGDGNDRMIGGNHADLFVSGEGAAVMSGGKGENMYLVSGKGSVTITDFDPEKDLLDFGGTDDPKDGFAPHMTTAGDDLIIARPDAESIVLTGMAARSDDLLGAVVSADDDDRMETIARYTKGMSPDQAEEVAHHTMAEDGSNLLFGDTPPAEIEDAFWPTVAERFLSVVAPDYAMENPPADPDAPSGAVPHDPTADHDPIVDPVRPGGTAGTGGTGGKPTVPTQPVDEADHPPAHDEDAAGGSGSCFVATAAYGDVMHPDVVDLRAFRDRVLIQTPAGRAFIAFYWRHGPALADAIRNKPRVRACCRASIATIVRIGRRAVGAVSG